MVLNVETPAILFPAITLLLLSYSNRYLSLSQLVRKLYKEYETSSTHKNLIQIEYILSRINMIRNMQTYGVIALIFCLFSIFTITVGEFLIGKVLFLISLIIFFISICYSLGEIRLSNRALKTIFSTIKND